MPTVSVIIPAYNEQATILMLLGSVRAQQIPGVQFEVIVIDDCSRDNTVALLRENPHLYDQLVVRTKNGGKGAAVKDGLAHATGDFILFQDADLEYDPEEYGQLLKPVLKYDADLVMGSRMLAPAYTRVFYFWHKVGNAIITLTFNLLNNTTFTDIYSCYLLYKREMVDPAKLTSLGWDQHAEILSKAWKKASACYEVPISYKGRTYAEGKKIRAKHAIGVILMIFRQRLARN